MRALISFTFVVLSFAGSLSTQRCKCFPAAADETTRNGANENIVMVEKQSHTRIAGVVSAGGDPASDVLVEVFDNPDHLLLPYPDSVNKRKAQRRVAACVVRDNGEFCFTNIPAGKYEVRFSKDGGWNHTSVVLTVGGRKATHEKLEIAMQVGT